MQSARSLLAVGLAALACLACSVSAAQAAPNNLVALGAGANANTLYRFSADSPGTIAAVPVGGLGASTLVGIDYRPATLELFGLGVSGNVATLFAIDPSTGAATQVGAPATITSIAGATAFGISFNPAVDRLRVVNNLATDGPGGNANNFRLNPNNGALAGLDVDLDFAGLPGGNSEAPEVAVAYDPKSAGTTAATLYGIVSGGDRLVRQGGVNGSPSANGGILSNIGPLGVDTSNSAGLDIDPAGDGAYAVLEVGGSSGLYRIDLATGGATSVGLVGDGAADFASLTIGPQLPTPPPPSPPPTSPVLISLKISPTRFAAASGKVATASKAAKKAAVGTTVNYTVSAAATVLFTVERKTTGRQVGGKCRKLTKGNREKKPCPLFKALRPTFSHAGSAGANSLRFNGKLGGKALAPGPYRLVAQTGASSLSRSFRILP